MGSVTRRRRVTRVSVGEGDVRRGRREETLAVEEPLEIRIGGAPFTVTMRTPGSDFDLVAGFLHGEGAVAAIEDISAMVCCTSDGAASEEASTFNVVDVALADGVTPPAARAFPMTSACGVCGKTSIEEIRQRAEYAVAGDASRIAPQVFSALPERLRGAQRVFDRTGGLHAAGIFDASGSLVVAREDVGRHNAADKVIGWALRERRLPLRGHILMLSGRASFELVQKALLAGFPAVAAVSAPSSLAVELAAESGMTLAGFVRGSSLNVYTGAERVT